MAVFEYEAGQMCNAKDVNCRQLHYEEVTQKMAQQI
jgi:hypothetical protein